VSLYSRAGRKLLFSNAAELLIYMINVGRGLFLELFAGDPRTIAQRLQINRTDGISAAELANSFATNMTRLSATVRAALRQLILLYASSHVLQTHNALAHVPGYRLRTVPGITHVSEHKSIAIAFYSIIGMFILLDTRKQLRGPEYARIVLQVVRVLLCAPLLLFMWPV
jgi:hypothetical protein